MADSDHTVSPGKCRSQCVGPNIAGLVATESGLCRSGPAVARHAKARRRGRILRTPDIILDLGLVDGPDFRERRDRPLAPVDPQVDNRPGHVSHDAKTRRMDRTGLPALVEPRLQRSKQSHGEWLAVAVLIAADHRRRHLVVGQQIARRNHALAGMDGVDAERVAARI